MLITYSSAPDCLHHELAIIMEVNGENNKSMCGISLIYHNNQRTPAAEAIAAMVKTMTHRGPDEQTYTIHGHAALGHTRLSIVDIHGGKQPMTSRDGRFHIIYNGEIYNYSALRSQLESKGRQFVSQSDTEVILQLFEIYGPDCLAKLRGMFSFIIYDQAQDSVFLARDRLGIKPLFYHFRDGTFVAASEIKCLFASGLVTPEFDPTTIRSHFTYQFSLEDKTLFKDVQQLLPGHFMMLKAGQTPRATCYWDLHFPKDGEYESMDEDFWTDRFKTALQDSAHCHTIGEVPIGAYLSGGIDSATTAWLLGKCYPKEIESFSVRFSNPDWDESAAFRSIAAHLNVNNSELYMDDNETQGFLPVLTEAMYYLEQPQRMAMDVPFYLLAKMVREKNYKVIYSGEGADEILAGYDFYRQDYMRLWGNDISDKALKKLLYFSQFTLNFSEHQMQMLYHNHETRQQQVQHQFGCYPVWYDFWSITDDMLPGLFQQDFEQQYHDPMPAAAEKMKPHIEGRHRINQSLYLETKTRLPNWILWRSDRMSMAHGVEARVPFLDHPLVELTAAMPPDLKLNGMNEKYILKKIAQPNLPQTPWQYKKRAFYTPIKQWFFRDDIRHQLEPYLSHQALQNSGIFNPTQVKSYLDRLIGFQAGNMNDYYMLTKLEWIVMLVLSVQILHHQFIDKQANCFRV